jgi:signal transduction histidine kinase
VLTAEGLESAEVSCLLQEELASQPEWSELPLIALGCSPQLRHRPADSALSSVVLLEPSLDERALVGVVRGALRRRFRQYQLQERLAHLTQSNRMLTESVRIKDEQFATFAHELRNPLAALLTASRLVSSDLANPATRKLAGDVIGRQVALMTRLLEDLLDVARIRLNRLELRRENCRLAAIVHSAVEATQPLMDAKEHTLRVELPEEDVVINADSARLSQVISNLLANAAKYTERHGEVVLSVRREAQEIVIEVQDNGIGIPPESLQEIFGMFTQLRAAAPRSKDGLGIGLSLVKGIVELHGGSVQAFSEGENRGTRFTVRLKS